MSSTVNRLMPQSHWFQVASPPGSGPPRPATVLAAICALAALVAGPVRADLWYQHYQKGLDALVREQWSEAIAELNQAIERRGDSGARVRTYGMRTSDYFPYLKLGIAYYGLGELDAALQAFETEDRLGAVVDSGESADELARYRALVEQAQSDRLAEERQRVSQIVDASLREARSLRDQGRLAEAITALGRGLAVAPEHTEANALMQSLRDQAQRLEDSRRDEEAAGRLVESGRDFQQQGAYREAASRFRQALDLRPGDPSIQNLLEQTQQRLRAELEAEEQRDRETFISQGLDAVRSLESQGMIDRALDRLETVLAFAPDDRGARELESRLLAARRTAEQEAARRAVAERELVTAESLMEAGRYEDALSAANRALASEPGNERALAVVARSYGEINRLLLGRSAAGNIPPAIRFADFRRPVDDGSLIQVVREPEFRLSGMVIDDSPVQIAFFRGGDQRLAGTTRKQQIGDFYLTEFSLDTTLEVGASFFRLVATDPENLTSSSEYAVLYARPWFRAPWLLPAVLGGVVFALAGTLIARARRVSRRRRRRYNPYVAGAPVLDERLFFGRDKLIDRILQTIHNNSLLLYGERRIGKTSIQHHLKRRLLELQDPTYEFYPVYIDLQGTPEERFFATIAEDVFQELSSRLGGMEELWSRPHADDYGYRDLVQDLRAVIKRLQEGTVKKVKLVLLIDEVDELNDYDPRINQRLRSLFMKSFADHLVAVVSGVEIKHHWERVGSPWYNFFEELEVKPLQDDEARDLIEKPILGILKLEDGVVGRVLELTERRPYLIQKLCIALVNQAYEGGRQSITLEDVEAIGRPEAA